MEEANDRLKKNSKSMPPCFNPEISSNTPIWMREFSSPPDEEPRKKRMSRRLLVDTLKTVGADRIVMGHTVQKQINSALGGRAWRIDVGASKGIVGGTPEVLEVRKEDGKETVSVLTRSGPLTSDDRATTTLRWYRRLF